MVDGDRMAPAVEANRLDVAATNQVVVGVCQTGELADRIASQGVARIDVEHFAGNIRAAKCYEREGFKVIRTGPPPTGESPNSAIVWRRRRLR